MRKLHCPCTTISASQINAGINLMGYHLPRAPRGFYTEMCAGPRAFVQQKMPGAGPINEDVPGVGHLHQLAFKHESCQHSHLGLKNKLSECRRGPGKVQKTQNAISKCSFALSP